MAVEKRSVRNCRTELISLKCQAMQAAMETARFTKLSFGGCDVHLEDQIPEHVAAELTAKGHQLQMHHGFSNTFGGGQAVMRDFSSGVNYGASDPRKDGAAVPELPLRGSSSPQ